MMALMMVDLMVGVMVGLTAVSLALNWVAEKAGWKVEQTAGWKAGWTVVE